MGAFRFMLILVFFVVQYFPASAQETRSVDLGGGVTLELVRIPKGEFTQGSPPTETGRGQDESTRKVTLTREFYLGKYPVTVGQFKRFVADTRYRTEAEKGESGGFGFDGAKLVQKKEFTWRNTGFPQTDEHPVTLVTYDDAKAFLRWLRGKTRDECNLPTEAMWEYACRAGTTTPWPGIAGEKQLRDIAWFKDNAGKGTQPVGKKKPNAFGLYDMCGNVYQWCRDWYAPYGAGDKTDPYTESAPAEEMVERRVLRGGSFLKDAAGCRAAARYRNTPGSRNTTNGFRVMAVDLVAMQPEAPELPAAPRDPPKRAADNSPINFSPPSAADTDGGWRYSTNSPFICICFFVPVLAVIAVVVVVVRRVLRTTSSPLQASSAPHAPPSAQPRVRLGDDGFWVEGPGIQSGMSVRYRCRVGGSEQQGEVATTSPSQFVYTGGTPSDVEIIEIRSAGGRPMGGTTFRSGPMIIGPGFTTTTRRTSGPPPSSRPSRPTDAEPFTGYPSAY